MLNCSGEKSSSTENKLSIYPSNASTSSSKAKLTYGEKRSSSKNKLSEYLSNPQTLQHDTTLLAVYSRLSSGNQSVIYYALEEQN